MSYQVQEVIMLMGMAHILAAILTATYVAIKE